MEDFTVEGAISFDAQIKKIINNGRLEGLERADSFFLQQILVRRFKLNNREEFDALVGIRESIEESMKSCPLPYCTPAASPIDSTDAVYAVMSLLFYQSKYSEHVSIDFVRQELTTYILSRHAIPFIVAISEELVELVIVYLDLIQDKFDSIVDGLNYFDFYSPLEMSLEVDFQKLLYIYHTTFYDVEQFISFNVYAGFQANEIKWCYGTDSNSKELQYFYNLGLPQYRGNVDIIVNKGDKSDNDNNVVINGYSTSNSLYIKIPLNEPPKMLDRKIDRVKFLLNTHYSNDNSLSASKLKQQDTCCLLKESRSISKVIYALACWDIAKRTPKSTVNSALETLSNDIDCINEILSDNQIEKEIRAYSEDSAKKYNDWMTSLIKGKVRTLDDFLTGNATEHIGKKARYR